MTPTRVRAREHQENVLEDSHTPRWADNLECVTGIPDANSVPISQPNDQPRTEKSLRDTNATGRSGAIAICGPRAKSGNWLGSTVVSIWSPGWTASPEVEEVVADEEPRAVAEAITDLHHPLR